MQPRSDVAIVGGLPITALDRTQTAQMMVEAAQTRPRGGRPLYLTSANGEVISRCLRDPALRDMVLAADQIAADGQPLVITSRLLCRQPLPERVATTDLFHDVAKRAQQQGLSFYMLGATPEENAKAVAATRKRYPRLTIVGHTHGFHTGQDLERTIAEIDTLRPDILWLAMGVPHEQRFMVEHGHKLTNVGVIKTAGGLFNFLSGKNSRAPMWMQRAGFEWAWRLYQEPRRLSRRYLVSNPIALYALLRHSC